MKKYILFIAFAYLFTHHFIAFATHIVGGEIQVTHVQDNLYELTFNMYFDEVNGNPNAEDQEISISIFSILNNQNIDNFILPKVSEERVNYSNPVCAISQLRTRYLKYSARVRLIINRYTDSNGYYVVWERCCRNGTIINIRNPLASGATFYTQFPALQINGQRFINSTPSFSIPKGDYACVGQPFRFDFSATDADGDFLVYSMENPMAGFSSQTNPNPIARPQPYPLVSWQTGFSALNAIQGSPALNINQQGLLTVTPSRTGLHVFSVKVEEYRNNVKIGEVRRDFQLMVIDCPTNAPPRIWIREENKSTFYNPATDVIRIKGRNDRCFDVLAIDPNINQTLTLSIRAINFNLRNNIISPTTKTITSPTDTMRSKACIPQCLFSTPNSPPFLLEIIVADSGCPISRNDTIRVQFISEPLNNNPPTIFTDLSGNTKELTVGDSIRFNIFARDIDNDEIIIKAQGRGFDLQALGMEFTEVSGRGNIQTFFRWITDCRSIKEARNEYLIDFITSDGFECGESIDTTTVLIILNDSPTNIDDFIPPNVFTPNNDGFNDAFTMTLPIENCRFQFLGIEIYNRWGTQVYKTKNKDFAWSAKDFPAGTYFYSIDYKSRKYKGTVLLLK